MDIYWHDINFGLNQLAKSILESGFKPDIIVGVGRGGLIPATLMSYKLNVKQLFNFSVQSYNDENVQNDTLVTVQEPGDALIEHKDKNVLVVDDLADKGITLAYIKNKLVNTYGINNLRTATLCIKDCTVFVPDYYVTVYSKDLWINFPWE
jgi:hypoxanthine phosphoribosyltransferase